MKISIANIMVSSLIRVNVFYQLRDCILVYRMWCCGIATKADKVDGILSSCTNISDLKALKQELAELLEEDAKSDKLRSLFVYLQDC